MAESLTRYDFPAGLLERVRHIDNIYKSTVRLLPVNQGSIVNGNKITFEFPADSIIDLKSLCLYY